MAKRSTRKKNESDDGSLFEETLPRSAAKAAPLPGVEDVPLQDLAQTRYLNYALSVITSRALPDVRDGLKPVQRRILYMMWKTGLKPDTKYRKSAKVVGDVMGQLHPHGDSSIYEALVRQSQPWVMRELLVEGSGNFGSIDGDPPAAMRYTECRLAPISAEILREIGENTVHFRPNYDGQHEEPVVLPSRLPNLLVNGSSGIAVGMATSIPPHNLGEVGTALIRLIDNPELTSGQLARSVKAPDFPTGGVILNTTQELTEIYKSGSGSVKVRAQWEHVKGQRGAHAIHIKEVPYASNKSTIVEQIADIVIARKMALITDVRDLSTDEICIEIDLKKDADPNKVMAYLFKHTPLQSNFSVNLTCLIPTENPEVCRPERCDLRTILHHFLHFRMEVVTKRLENELRLLNNRIHILEGFALVFDALDEIIAIIRKSDGKADAAKKIMKRFAELDEIQTDAILELKLYRLAKLEINLVRDELNEKRRRSDEIDKLLNDTEATGRWGMIRNELKELLDQYAKGKMGARRSVIAAPTEEEPEYSAEDFIVAEDCHVLVTSDGWVKRQKEIKDPNKTRLREGDTVLACQAASTKSTFAFFSNFGACYTARVIDLPATTGHGEPVQKLFKFKDGEKIIAAMSMDPRVVGNITTDSEDYAPEVHAIAATTDGYALRFGLDGFVEPSTRSGRRYARPAKGQAVVSVYKITGHETILAATVQARALVCSAEEVNYLAGPGKGVILIRLNAGDQLLAFKPSTGDRDLLTLETARGAKQNVSTGKYKVTARGGKGHEVIKRGSFLRALPDEVPPPALFD